MAEGTVPYTTRNATLTIKDGTGTPLDYEVALEDGDFSCDIPQENIIAEMDRGVLTGQVRLGDDQPITGSFTALVKDIANATDITLWDIVNNSGVFAATWVSTQTAGASAEVKTCDMEYALDTTGGTVANTLIFSNVVFRGAFQESVGDYTRITTNFTAYAVRPTYS